MNRQTLTNEISGYWFEIKFLYDPDKTFCITHDFLMKLHHSAQALYHQITHLTYCDESDNDIYMHSCPEKLQEYIEKKT